jgi:hypothetical protein
VAGLSLVDSSAVAGGVRYFWLDDDQMVAMRYARNLASGHGLTFNPGQAVEGYTSLLWTLVMAAVHLLPVSDAKASLVVALVNWGLAAGVLVLVRRLGILWGLGSLILALGTFSVALSFELLYYTAHGFETTLLMLVFLWVVCRLVEEARSRAPRLPTYLGAGLLPLVRSDFLALLAVIPLAALALGRSRNGAPRRGLPVAAYAAAALLPPLCHLVLRHAIYGRWLPNAYHLKVAGVAPSFPILAQVDERDRGQPAARPGADPVPLHVVRPGDQHHLLLGAAARILDRHPQLVAPAKHPEAGVTPPQLAAVEGGDDHLRRRQLGHGAVVRRGPGGVVVRVAAATRRRGQVAVPELLDGPAREPSLLEAIGLAAPGREDGGDDDGPGGEGARTDPGHAEPSTAARSALRAS